MEKRGLEQCQLWGGIECTINRIGERFYSQMGRRSIPERLGDLDRIAKLGIRAMRFPVLWEEVQPRENGHFNWAWADAGLGRLRALGIQPIVGLVHHGSGPSYTNLLDPSFPAKLAGYAREVAERFPWVEAYTPVNEPLTTARFSALYGHWYPHQKSAGSFCVALLNQIRATTLAMEAIRAVAPGALLVQTDDLGLTLSSPKLAYQAEFENERRWATFDLLTGRLNPEGRMWGYFIESGVSPAVLEGFLERPCPPSVIGVNHYITSCRFLDDNLSRYHPSQWGGNALQAYVDLEAVRSPQCAFQEPLQLLRQTWDRYQIPLAITEAHMGSTREEQMRWFAELWRAASQAREEGIPVQAVTAWSLLGAYDWDSLLVRQAGHYEPGPFDLRAPEPRLTALGQLIAQVAQTRRCAHELINVPGWWRREVRLPCPERDSHPKPWFIPSTIISSAKTRPVLITGATGTLGQAFARICYLRGIPYRLLSRTEMDIADERSVREILGACQPWAMINAAGYVRVDAAENDSAKCLRENVLGPGILAKACAESEVKFLTFSSDLVFDGTKQGAYLESDAVFPLSVYGLSKAEAELDIARANPDALIVRTSSFFGPWDSQNFIIRTLRALNLGRVVSVAEDTRMSPTYVPELVHGALDLLIDGERGIWHLANTGATSWADFACAAAGRAKLDVSLLQRCVSSDLKLPAKRPRNSALSSERGLLLGPWQEALERYFWESPALAE